MKVKDYLIEAPFEKARRKLEKRSMDKYLKKAREKGGERSRNWDAYTGLLELAERLAKHIASDVKAAKKTPGYNLDNMMDGWESTIKEFRIRLKGIDKKVN